MWKGTGTGPVHGEADTGPVWGAGGADPVWEEEDTGFAAGGEIDTAFPEGNYIA